MKRPAFMTTGAMALLIGMAVGSLAAQQPPAPAGPQPFTVGNRLGMPIAPAPDGAFTPMSSNVKVYGAIYSAESCSYDAGRGVIVVPNRGVGQNVQTNNAWISFINHDGSVHTARWVGIQNPGEQRSNMTTPLVMNEPFGSDIVNGILYLADRDGGTNPNDPVVAVVRKLRHEDWRPGGRDPRREIERLQRSRSGRRRHDLRDADWCGRADPDPTTWQVWKITKDGTASMFVQGAPLRQPNGVALDEKGNIVVVNIGNNEVLTFSQDAKLMKTETAVQAGNDGLVIMPDGTKYVSSVTLGGVSRIRPGQPAELIAQNIPNAASMCYDAGANQLVIPMNANNAMAFIPLK